MSAALDEIRRTVSDLHQELVRNRLVAWTSGNVSARVPGTDLVVIKPSGVAFDELTPEAMVVVDLDANVVEGDYAPSSDTATHCFIYRAMADVGGIAHTHSPFATAWAARGEEIPCVLTAMADEFGGPIPVGPFALIGGEEIGRVVVETLSGHRSPAMLLSSHGVVGIGPSARSAIKAVVMCEDVARTVHYARAFGDVAPLEQGAIDSLYDRYQNVYGQP
jgi:L-ribulose-5-phosphate 4-epimerase